MPGCGPLAWREGPQPPEQPRIQGEGAVVVKRPQAANGRADVTRLGIYATDVDEALKNFDLLGTRFGPLNAAPPTTVLGVTRLAIPPLMFEIEATAEWNDMPTQKEDSGWWKTIRNKLSPHFGEWVVSRSSGSD